MPMAHSVMHSSMLSTWFSTKTTIVSGLRQRPTAHLELQTAAARTPGPQTTIKVQRVMTVLAPTAARPFTFLGLPKRVRNLVGGTLLIHRCPLLAVDRTTSELALTIRICICRYSIVILRLHAEESSDSCCASFAGTTNQTMRSGISTTTCRPAVTLQ
eukprot:SAG11_NODE_9612_length_896_cov_1.156838_1_plen_158_part_00